MSNDLLGREIKFEESKTNGRHLAFAEAVSSGLNATGTVGHGNTLTITDSENRLGTKDQAAPRYWIFGDEVYIDGVKKDDYEQLESGTQVPDTSWLRMEAVLTEARQYRHNRIARHFHGTGRTHTKEFLNLENDAASENRNAIYVSCWMRLGYQPGFGAQVHDVISITGSPDYGNDPHDADGEDIELDGSVVGRLIGLHTRDGTDYLAYIRYSSGTNLDSKTVTGVSSGAGISLGADSLNVTAKSVRMDPSIYPSVVSVGVHSKATGSHFVFDSNRDSIYTVGGDDFAGIDRGDAAVNDTDQYDDTPIPFPRWGKYHFWKDFTGTYMRDRFGRDYKNLKYWSSYEALTQQEDPAIDEENGLVPVSRSQPLPRVTNLGFEPGSNRDRGIGNVDFSEIYVDRTARRVVIGNAPTWDQVTLTEDQRANTWNPNQIDFVQNLGAFGDQDSFWIYVMDDFDEPVFTSGISRSEVSQ